MTSPEGIPQNKPTQENTSLAIEGLKFEFGEATQIGKYHKRVNQPNQDTFFSLPEKGVFGVLDGVGGHNAGDVASATARDEIKQAITELTIDSTKEERIQKIKDALLEAHKSLIEKAKGNPELYKMATTALIALFEKLDNTRQEATLFLVGDCRACVLRANETTLEQVTIDGTFVNDELKKGGYNEEAIRDAQKRSGRDELKIEEVAFRNMYGRVINNSLGGNSKSTGIPKNFSTILNEGDILVMGSDGLFGGLTEKEIIETIRAGGDMKSVAEQLIRKVSLGTRTEDDSTALVIKVQVA